jgi:hypothetical protein
LGIHLRPRDDRSRDQPYSSLIVIDMREMLEPHFDLAPAARNSPIIRPTISPTSPQHCGGGRVIGKTQARPPFSIAEREQGSANATKVAGAVSHECPGGASQASVPCPLRPPVMMGCGSARGADCHWAFWVGHTIIMASAVYDLAVREFGPDWRDVGRVILVSLAHAAAVGADQSRARHQLRLHRQPACR